MLRACTQQDHPQNTQIHVRDQKPKWECSFSHNVPFATSSYLTQRRPVDARKERSSPFVRRTWDVVGAAVSDGQNAQDCEWGDDAISISDIPSVPITLFHQMSGLTAQIVLIATGDLILISNGGQRQYWKETDYTRQSALILEGTSNSEEHLEMHPSLSLRNGMWQAWNQQQSPQTFLRCRKTINSQVCKLCRNVKRSGGASILFLSEIFRILGLLSYLTSPPEWVVVFLNEQVHVCTQLLLKFSNSATQPTEYRIGDFDLVTTWPALAAGVQNPTH